MLIHVTNLLSIGNDTDNNQINREIKNLANELNSELPDYEVRLIHLDGEDYLEFIRKSDEEFINEVLDASGIKA